MADKWIYQFEEVGRPKPTAGGKWDGVLGLLGGKGANLAEMTRLGVPVPPGFTITTEACNAYLDSGGSFPDGMWEEVQAAMANVEQASGKTFGDPQNPLLDLLPFRSPLFHAGHDGHGLKHRPQRRDRQGDDRTDRGRPFCL